MRSNWEFIEECTDGVRETKQQQTERSKRLCFCIPFLKLIHDFRTMPVFNLYILRFKFNTIQFIYDLNRLFYLCGLFSW